MELDLVAKVARVADWTDWEYGLRHFQKRITATRETWAHDGVG